MGSDDKIRVAVLVEAGGDARERDELTTRLRRELLRLDVDAVERPPTGVAPPGTRAVDLASVGALLVTLAQTTGALTALVTAVRAWLGAHGSGTVKLSVGGDTIEVSGQLTDAQKDLVAAWIKAREPR